MENIHLIATKVQAQIVNFLGKLSVNKPTKRLVIESVYGIQARQSVRLTEIARALNEPIGLHKTVKRLSRGLEKAGLEEKITEHIVKNSAQRIGQDTLLVVDPSDITKKYAKAMQYQAHVRDGSTGKIESGYWFCSVIGVACGGRAITPLCNRLWSQNSPDFESENKEVIACIDSVARHLEGRGIWVMDRGADRLRFYERLLERELDFLIRLVGNRHLLYQGKPRLAEEIADSCQMSLAKTVVKQCKDGSERAYNLQLGVRRVRLPKYSNTPLWMVVIRGFGKKPLMLLTTKRVRQNYKDLEWALEAYLTRWRIEDTIRFAKQSYQLEDVRLLGYKRLQNMMGLVLAAMSFTMTHLSSETKLKVLCNHALRAGKRLFGVPEFKYYALADGLKELFSPLKKRLKWGFNTKPPGSSQLILPSFALDFKNG